MRQLGGTEVFRLVLPTTLQPQAAADAEQTWRSLLSISELNALHASGYTSVDGRSVILALTPKGKPVWRKLMALMEQRNQALMGCLTPTEQGQLIDLFERMLAQAKAGV